MGPASRVDNEDSRWFKYKHDILRFPYLHNQFIDENGGGRNGTIDKQNDGGGKDNWGKWEDSREGKDGLN